MEVFVARQPIFDKHQKVYAYELLFRSGLQNIYNAKNGDQATSNVINTSFGVIGLETLTSGKMAFINFTGNLLKEGIPALLPNKLLAVEILENIEPDLEIIIACNELKKKGYTMVLDDFVLEPRFAPLIKLADIIKVDFLGTSLEDCRNMIEMIGKNSKTFLAEKVESMEVFNAAISFGYTLFQGYFFSKPQIVSGRDIPPSKLNYILLLRELGANMPDYNKIADIIARDISLSYKLLKLINSTFYGLRTKITSIKHALVMLGIDEVRKWVSLTVINGLGQNKPDELMKTSIIRAKFCEVISKKIGIGNRASELFLMGLFSMIDALIDQPMEIALKELPLTKDVKSALLGEKSPFKIILDLIIAYEKGTWSWIDSFAGILKLQESEIPELYLESLKWTEEFMSL